MLHRNALSRISLSARAGLPYLADVARLTPLKGLGRDPEFTPATWLTGVTPGTLLRAEPIEPVGLRTRLNPADGHRISYATSDSRSRCLSATGAVLRSRVPWTGPGPRPTVAFAPSTQGVAPRCDPSYSCTVGLGLRTRPLDAVAAYEQPVISLLIAAGADVVLSDYPRDPEDNVQLYSDHFSSARALADAVRAARMLGVGAQRLGLWGYSQGGGAVAAWLEQPEYTPELQPLAAVVGAPPVHLPDVLRHVEGSLLSVVALYAVAGFVAWDADIAAELFAHLSPAGARAVMEAGRVCALGAVLEQPWASTRAWTASGKRMSEMLETLPLTSERLSELELGTHRPLRIPLRLWAGLHDDVIPYASLRRFADRWGVELETRRPPRVPGRTGANHIVPYFAHARRDVQWLVERLGG